MFWIGLIVGIIVGVVALWLLSKALMVVIFGSFDQYKDGFELLLTANDNRKSYLQAFTDDEILDTVVFEER